MWWSQFTLNLEGEGYIFRNFVSSVMSLWQLSMSCGGNSYIIEISNAQIRDASPPHIPRVRGEIYLHTGGKISLMELLWELNGIICVNRLIIGSSPTMTIILLAILFFNISCMTDCFCFPTFFCFPGYPFLLCSFLRAAITKYDKLGDLRQQKCIVS